MTDTSTSTDKLEFQAAPVASSHTPSPVATPPIVAAESDITPPTIRAPQVATLDVTPEVPQRDTLIDPRVISLRSMFPDYEDLILCVPNTRCPHQSVANPITGCQYLNLWAETRIVPLMPYSV